MERKMVDITLHVNEETSQDERDAIRDRLLGIDGVMAADYKNDKPHLFVVEFDPDTISATALMGAVNDSGFHAQVVSM
jgi:copper chaperone CopZ